VNPRPHIAIVIGTRPEAIKLYPVLDAFGPAVAAGDVRISVVSTGQQRQLLDQAFGFFGIQPDADLGVMGRPDEPLGSVFARTVAAMTAWMHELPGGPPSRVVVQGDTLSAHAGATAAFYAGVPVSHVEAGLRTWDNERPFPEELHRRAIALAADQHFCPTPGALANLRSDGIDTQSAHVVGNSVIDAMRLCADRIARPTDLPKRPEQRLFVTVHRRENLPLLATEILPALRRLVADHPNVDAIVPVHPNPAVGSAIARVVDGCDRITTIPPVAYGQSLGLVRDATLVVTDSGGLQEEATALGTPVVVLRGVSERTEAIDDGNAILAGTSAVAIARVIHGLLSDPAALAAMARPNDVFGDGHAASRIVASVLSIWGIVPRAADSFAAQLREGAA